jgi:hypothetical protein
MNALFGFPPETPAAAWCLTGAIGALALLVVIATGGKARCDLPAPSAGQVEEWADPGQHPFVIAGPMA